MSKSPKQTFLLEEDGGGEKVLVRSSHILVFLDLAVTCTVLVHGSTLLKLNCLHTGTCKC